MICLDFDKTVTIKNTFWSLLRDSCRPNDYLLNMLKESPGLIAALLGMKPWPQMREQLFNRFFWSWSEEKFRLLCDFTVKKQGDILRPEIVQLIENAAADNEEIVVVSDNVEPLIEAYLKSYPHVKIIGTKLDAYNEIISGKYKTPRCVGIEKVRRLLEEYPDRKTYNLKVYASTSENIELLDYADEGYWMKK